MYNLHSMKFGEILKCYRLQLHLKQDSMAKLLCVPLGTYKSWEYDHNFPSMERLDKICKILDNTFCDVSPLPSYYLHEKFVKGKLKNG